MTKASQIEARQAEDRRPDKPGRKRTDAKRRDILEGAGKVFLSAGYGAASMDAVADAAGVSKMTVYRYFPGKEALFAGLLEDMCSRIVDDELGAELEAADPADALRAFAEKTLEVIYAPETVALHRIVIAEAGRFPELGRLFYDSGPAPHVAALAEYFADRAGDPGLRISDPVADAEAFLSLVRGYAHQRLLLGAAPAPNRPERQRQIDAAIARFMAG